MQEILAEIWPPLLMVVFGGGSIVAAILGKAICSLDQNSSFPKSFNACFKILLIFNGQNRTLIQYLFADQILTD